MPPLRVRERGTNDDVRGWPSTLLGEVYAELTGTTVVVDEEETTGIAPTIVGLDDRGRYVLVTYRVPCTTSRAETNSAIVPREDLVAEARERDRITIDERARTSISMRASGRRHR